MTYITVIKCHTNIYKIVILELIQKKRQCEFVLVALVKRATGTGWWMLFSDANIVNLAKVAK